MTTYHPTLESHEVRRLGHFVAQLTQPIHMDVLQQQHTWTGARNRRRERRWVHVEHPPLLVQLLNRAMLPESNLPGPERQPVPSSKPPLNLEPVSAARTIVASLDRWQRCYPIGNWPPVERTDACATMIWRLYQLAAETDRELAFDIYDDVATWRRWAAVYSGWRLEDLPEEKP